MRVGLLHTVPGLAPVFDARLRESLPDAEAVHLVHAGALTRALAGSPDLPEQVRSDLGALVGLGCEAILVTCSSLGEVVDALGPKLPVPVLRVDVPMAAEAARIAAGLGTGRCVVVLATQPSTLGPSAHLVSDAAAAGFPEAGLTVEAVLVEGAAAALAGGDPAEHDRLVRAAVDSVHERADVVVLAQASMAAAVDGVDVGLPLLTSPRSGVAALAAALAGPTTTGLAAPGSAPEADTPTEAPA